MRACDHAALATLQRNGAQRDGAQRDGAQRDGDGWPYPSLVQVATDRDGSPLLLISALADHTKNLGRDGRAGLLFDGTALGGVPSSDRLAGSRVSVLGRLAPSDDPGHRARFLARHPAAALYAGFGDFRIWRMAVERAHLVAGFGRIHWIDAAALILPPDDWQPLAGREADVIGHMNEDHAEAIALYATALLGLPPGDWRLTAIDPDGCDLSDGGRAARLPFDKPARDAEAARVELVRLVKRARGTGPP
jgi:putative heme iron utilization protein